MLSVLLTNCQPKADHNNENIDDNGGTDAKVEPIDVSKVDENGNEGERILCSQNWIISCIRILDMARTEIIDEEIGSASDDNSASEKHKKVFIS